MYLLSIFPGPQWGEEMYREPGVMIKKLKASVHSLTTSIISDLSCPKGRTEAGVRQRLAGRRVCLSGTESGKDEYRVREDQRTEDTLSKLPINSEF